MNDLDRQISDSFWRWPKEQRMAFFEKQYKKSMWAIRFGLQTNDPGAVEVAKELNVARDNYYLAESER